MIEECPKCGKKVKMDVYHQTNLAGSIMATEITCPECGHFQVIDKED